MNEKEKKILEKQNAVIDGFLGELAGVASKAADSLRGVLAETQSELAALDKPELRHGDYGFYEDSLKIPCLAVQPYVEGTPKVYFEDGSFSENTNISNPKNIFDDLASLAEPLEIWTSDKSMGSERQIRMQIEDDGTIWFGTHGYGGFYVLETIAEIHRNLGRLIATAKRKVAEK